MCVECSSDYVIGANSEGSVGISPSNGLGYSESHFDVQMSFVASNIPLAYVGFHIWCSVGILPGDWLRYVCSYLKCR